MLRRFNKNRKLSDNIRLGVLTASVAGLVNVASFLLFFSFSSNVTGYYAIMISELSNGNWYQFSIVAIWILSFFLGSFISNYIVVNFSRKSRIWAHATPIIIEILCLGFVGVYGLFYYANTLIETEVLLLIMLFAMGLQNGLTASISNFLVKTTHLTGLTTDLAILASLYVNKQYKSQPQLLLRVKLLFSIFVAYLVGGLIGSCLYKYIGFGIFFIACLILASIIAYDLSYAYKIQGLKQNRNNPKDPVKKGMKVYDDREVGLQSQTV